MRPGGPRRQVRWKEAGGRRNVQAGARGQGQEQDGRCCATSRWRLRHTGRSWKKIKRKVRLPPNKKKIYKKNLFSVHIRSFKAFLCIYFEIISLVLCNARPFCTLYTAGNPHSVQIKTFRCPDVLYQSFMIDHFYL